MWRVSVFRLGRKQFPGFGKYAYEYRHQSNDKHDKEDPVHHHSHALPFIAVWEMLVFCTNCFGGVSRVESYFFPFISCVSGLFMVYIWSDTK